jgi:hypothetical protein
MNAAAGLADLGDPTGSVREARVNQRSVVSIWMVLLAAALAASGLALYERAQLQDARAHLVAQELEPLAALLNEDRTLMGELGAEPYTEKDSGILESYLTKIRRDGVPKHADMKQKLDQLAENNTAIVTLIKAYAPQAKTPRFAAEGDKFRNYASAWRDRWNSVMELFMAGGNYAAAGVPFPAGIAAAVEAEIQAR